MPHPTIVTESGRAVVAHHSVLVVDVLGVSEFDVGKAPEQARRATPPRVVQQPVRDLPASVSRKNLLEAYHDALEYKEECLQLFNLGHLSLEQRVRRREPLLGDLPEDPDASSRELREVPEELEGLEKALVRHLLLQLLDVPVAARHIFLQLLDVPGRCPTSGPSWSRRPHGGIGADPQPGA